MDKGDLPPLYCQHGIPDGCAGCQRDELELRPSWKPIPVDWQPRPTNGSDLVSASMPDDWQPEPTQVSTQKSNACPACGLIPCKTHGPSARIPSRMDRIRPLMAAYSKLEDSIVMESRLAETPSSKELADSLMRVRRHLETAVTLILFRP